MLSCYADRQKGRYADSEYEKDHLHHWKNLFSLLLLLLLLSAFRDRVRVRVACLELESESGMTGQTGQDRTGQS